MQHSASAPDRRSGRSLAVRVGALTAALSLMLVGGVAVASASSAAVHFDKGGNGNGNSDNAPGQNKPDGGNGGNGGNPNPGGGGGGGNGGNGGNGGVGDLTEKKIWVCHADTNNGNGQNNLGNGGQGGENKNGFNLIHISVAAWENQHNRLHENDFTLTDEQVAAGVTCGGGGSEPVPASLCVIATGEIVPFADNTSKAYTDALADTATYATTCPSGGNPAKRAAQPSAPLCVVVGGEYQGVTSVTVDVVEVTDPAGNGDAAQAQADEKAEKALEAALITKQQGDNIVPPWSGKYHSYAGYNWNDQTQARFNAGCSPNQSVISAVLPGTIAEKPAGGNPQPGKVGSPAAATMPGSVNAGGGSSAPALPLWALALVIAGAIGAAASGAQLMGNRK